MQERLITGAMPAPLPGHRGRVPRLLLGPLPVAAGLARSRRSALTASARGVSSPGAVALDLAGRGGDRRGAQAASDHSRSGWPPTSLSEITAPRVH